MIKITKYELGALLGERKEDGNIFSVTFTKKNGETRTMVSRFNVKKHLKGGTWANGNAKPTDYRLCIVFDMQKQAYRSFPVDSVIKIKTEDTEYVVG